MTSDSIFSYTFSNGVHCIAPLVANGEAIKAMLAHIEQVFNAFPEDDKVRVMVDFRPAGPPPIAQGIPHLLDFFRRQGHKTTRPARIAYLYPRATQSRILSAFLQMQRFLPQKVTVKFFVEGEHDKAWEWLQGG